jgi:hypothetical protein
MICFDFLAGFWKKPRRTNMKRSLWINGLVFLIIALCAGSISYAQTGYPLGGGDPQGYNQRDHPDQDTSYFYDRSAPYGNWIELAPHGYV